MTIMLGGKKIMNNLFFFQIHRKHARIVLIGLFLFLYFTGYCLPLVYAQEIYKSNNEAIKTKKISVSQSPLRQINEYCSTQIIAYSDGTSIERIDINGPPTPPPGYEIERTPVLLPDDEMGIKTLTVPAYNWVFGCSSVSGAMIAGYYDRNGYLNMYTGPTNGGVIPLNNSSWPTWSDGYKTYPNLPLAASHQGVDGRTTRGSIDDYWVKYNSTAQDPYILGGWTQHTWSTAIGDYMKTSQSSYSNVDGSTSFYNWNSSPIKLTCSDMVSYNIHTKDGTYGRKLFYEDRGYTVTDCYNQKTDNNSGGFTFANYKAEINAGRPVMLNVEGHTMVGIGYNDTGNIVYLHDTWDYSNHTMIWGGSYSGMALESVSIVNLAPSRDLTVRVLPFLSLILDNGSPAPPPSCPIIPNGTFESGHVNWTEYSSHGWDIIVTTSFAHNGSSYLAWLGGDDSDTSYIEQQVSVPASCPYLIFYHYISSEDYCGYDNGYVRINGSSIAIYQLCNPNNTGGWVKKSLNLSSYAGQSVSLQFRAVTDSSYNSNWYIDDVSFQSSSSAGTISEPATIHQTDESTARSKAVHASKH